MKEISRKDLDGLDKAYRINLINSCSGYKSANLLATISKEGIPNLAIFSSVTHLGTSPPLLGFVLRPTTVPRHTYANIKEEKFFSINHVSTEMIRDAHHTAARYDENISEFDETGLQLEYKKELHIPFVKNAPVQMLMQYVGEYIIKENNTRLIVASVEVVFVEERMLNNDGFINLSKGNVVTINGLDAYNSTELLDRFAYAKPKKETKSIHYVRNI